MYQKPMPKQDKGGGIIPTAESARFWPWERHGEVPFVASPLAVSRPSLALNTRETRGWCFMLQRIMFFGRHYIHKICSTIF